MATSNATLAPHNNYYQFIIFISTSFIKYIFAVTFDQIISSNFYKKKKKRRI